MPPLDLHAYFKICMSVCLASRVETTYTYNAKTIICLDYFLGSQPLSCAITIMWFYYFQRVYTMLYQMT